MRRLETLYMGTPGNIIVCDFGYFKKNADRRWFEYFCKYDLLRLRSILKTINIELEDVVSYIEFIPVYYPTEKKTKYVPRFTMPVAVIIDKILYRMSISYLGLMVSKEGYVYSLLKRKIVFDPKLDKNKTTSGGYPHIKSYNTVSNKESIVAIHRLVAFEWVLNYDYVNNCVVDHIDGNKKNPVYDNLRWLSNTDNIKASLDQGLKKDHFQVLVRNIDTGAVLYFPSLTQATEYMGRSRITTTVTDIHPKRIWKGNNGRFNIKSIADQRSWDNDDDVLEGTGKLDKYSVTVFINGVEKRYSSVNIAAKLLLHSTNVRGRESFLKHLIRHFGKDVLVVYNDSNVKVEKDGLIKEYQNIEGVLDQVPDLAKYSKSSLTKYANAGREVNGYRIWFSNCDIGKDRTNKPFTIKLTDVDTKEELTFDSFRKASRYLNRDRHTLRKYIKSGKPILEKFKIEKIEPSV